MQRTITMIPHGPGCACVLCAGTVGLPEVCYPPCVRTFGRRDQSHAGRTAESVDRAAAAAAGARCTALFGGDPIVLTRGLSAVASPRPVHRTEPAEVRPAAAYAATNPVATANPALPSTAAASTGCASVACALASSPLGSRVSSFVVQRGRCPRSTDPWNK